jgi:hypothetical protein
MNHCDCLVASKNSALAEIIPLRVYQLSLDTYKDKLPVR